MLEQMLKEATEQANDSERKYEEVRFLPINPTPTSVISPRSHFMGFLGNFTIFLLVFFLKSHKISNTIKIE